MHPVGLLTALTLLAAPPAGGRVGVVWHDQATVRHDARQRLVDALVDRGGLAPESIVVDADLRGRVAVAHRFSPDLADKAALLDVTLTGAAASYRAGEVEAAATALGRVESSLRSDPGIAAAAALMGRVAILRAQIAWTRGDDAAVDEALGVALTLDPEGRLSTRTVAPPIVAAHTRLAAALEADRARWVEITADGVTGPVAIEVDGRPSPGPVPPGEHFVVVRRPGFVPIAALVRTPDKVAVPPTSTEVVRVGLPADRADAEALCEAVEVDQLLLARQRGRRIGLQGYVCGEGFAPAEFSIDESPDDLVAVVLAANAGPDVQARLQSSRPWPAIETPLEGPALGPEGPSDGGGEVVGPKPWFRRVWVWAVIGTAVAGAVTTGVVLGTRPGPDRLQVDTDTFMPMP